MTWRIEVAPKPDLPDIMGEDVVKGAHDMGLSQVRAVKTATIYRLEGQIAREDVVRICEELLADPVTQRYAFEGALSYPDLDEASVVEVAYNPGVMDPVEASVRKAISDLAISGLDSIRTARKYVIYDAISDEDVRRLCDALLANKVIQHVVLETEDRAPSGVHYEFEPVYVGLLSSDDAALERISREGLLSLSLAEMHAIQDYFAGLGRNPTDAELETLAQTWSEHCVHKTLRGRIEFEGETIDNLLKNTVFRVTKELNRPWCVSVFEDNAGVVEFDDRYNVCFKVETHNHPSAIEPYGGAGTGIGGVIRDPLGTGLGAKPILNTDVFCFGPPNLPWDKVPPGCLHPRRVFKGVVAGVRDYGNRMGIPTANGAIYFDERYIGNPLVYCGNVGLMPRDKSFEHLKEGDLIVVVGGRTGRDGIHGVTFASDDLTSTSESISGGAVQIGNPITEKKMADVLLKARDLELYDAITDCGGGGLSSAIGEMGEEIGAEVDLEKIPVKYEGLRYTEVWISEAQERMLLAVPPENVDRLIDLFAREDVEATVIGRFGMNGRLVLRYEGHTVCDLDCGFLHTVPKITKKAVWKQPAFEEPAFEEPADLAEPLKRILAAPNVCSKEWVIRQYDHEVQGGSVLKPLQGIRDDGPGDACVVRPLLDSKRGLIVSNGLNPKYGLIDPYHMAASAIDEALRQIVAVGGALDRTALLDNFCWGNPDKPDRLGGLVRAAQACYDIAKVYGTPFISGKDSLYNEFIVDGDSVPIPPTLLISAISVMENVERAVSMDLKAPDDLLYVVGMTYDELGGSHYYAIQGYTGNAVPRVRPQDGRRTMDALSRATARGLVRACHDCSEGGIGVALAEMAFSGEIGVEVHLAGTPRSSDMRRNDAILFSESNSRFLVEVSSEHRAAFERVLKDVAFGCIGATTTSGRLIVHGADGTRTVDASLADLKEAWQAPFRSV